MLVVKKHSGRSGMSVYGWRVYRILPHGKQFQLSKHRTQEAAAKALAYFEEREAALNGEA